MTLCPFVPYDPGADVDRAQLVVRAVTLHRTIGSWPGDYTVGKNRLHTTPGTFNYLIGQAQDEWVQFYSAETWCSHAAGANFAGPGCELSGQNGEALTPWQLTALGELIRWLGATFAVPVEYYDARRIRVDGSDWSGFISHRAVSTLPQWEHHDYIEQAEFAAAVAAPAEEDGMRLLSEKGTGAWFISDGVTKRYIGSPAELTLWTDAKVPQVVDVDPSTLGLIPDWVGAGGPSPVTGSITGTLTIP